MTSTRFATLASAVVALYWTWAQPAAACSRSSCMSGGFFFPRAGSVPANLPAIAWWRQRNVESSGGDFMPGADEVRFARVDGSTLERVKFEIEMVDRLSGHYVIRPSSPFVVGAQYVIWADPWCGRTAPAAPPEGSPRDEVAVARFTVSEAAELPSTLGTLSATAPESAELELAGGSACSYKQLSVYVDLTLELSAAAVPWRDALFESTEVEETGGPLPARAVTFRRLARQNPNVSATQAW